MVSGFVRIDTDADLSLGINSVKTKIMYDKNKELYQL
ncbi:MAG: hypothetical protein QG588_641 [Candidatus Poribacteria bacterium]|nr:hypothetical protein [Candidatus Poribacteria bacterium]